MKDFIGGIEPGTMVNVMDKKTKKVKKKKLVELKAGEWIGQADSYWYFAVNEVRIFRRELRGFKITLESGEKLTVAENTILCGQFGGNLVTEQDKEVLCLANMGRFVDTDDSRRTFKIEFQAPKKYSKRLKTICRHSSNRLGSDYEKKFYGYSDVLKFLQKLNQKLPHAHAIMGLEIDRHYKDKLYDICQARPEHEIFFPLFQFTDLYDEEQTQHFPKILAFCPKASGVECRKVVSCEVISSDGPWAFPIFDDYNNSSTPSQHRFSFTANGIPVFYPNDFISDWAVKKTLPKKGEPQLPPMPTKEENKNRDPICWDLDSVYNYLLELSESKTEDLTNEMAQKAYDSIFGLMRMLAACKVGRKELIGGLERKVIALHRSRSVPSIPTTSRT